MVEGLLIGWLITTLCMAWGIPGFVVGMEELVNAGLLP